MRAHDRLAALVDEGVIEEVLRPLLAGKEAEVYLVRHQGRLCVAKLYKEAQHRSFRNRADYTEGRKVRSSRTTRAMGKHSAFGKEQEEEAWRSAEVNAIYKLRAHGVRVPEPYAFVDGVLVMELISDGQGNPAPRLADLRFEEREALNIFYALLKDVVRMLLAGVVHGDLSDFNVLISDKGPVIIDLPQWTDPAHNRNAERLLVRDVDNLTHFLGNWAPVLKGKQYGREMWQLYERNALTEDTRLTGRYQRKGGPVDTASLLDEIAAAARAEHERRVAMGIEPKRKPVNSGYVAPTAAEREAERQRLAEQETRRAEQRERRALREDRGPRNEGGPRPPREERGGREGPGWREERGPRPPREDRGPRPAREDRGPRTPREAGGGREDRGPRPSREDQPPRPPREDRPWPERPTREDRGQRPPREDGPWQDRGPRPPREDSARQDRAPHPDRSYVGRPVEWKPEGQPVGRPGWGPRPPRPEGQERSSRPEGQERTGRRRWEEEG